MMLPWFWASGNPPQTLKNVMRARAGLLGCCGCLGAPVFRKKTMVFKVFVLFRNTACCIPLDAVLKASRRAPREFEGVWGGVGGPGGHPLKLSL